MKNKRIHEFFAATAFGVVFANASLTANAEELPEESTAVYEEDSEEAEETQSSDESGAEGAEEVESSDESGAEGAEEVQSFDESGTEGAEEVESSDEAGNEGTEEAESPDQSDDEKTEEDKTQLPDLSGGSGQEETPGLENTEGNESQEKGPASFEEAKEILDQAREEEALAKSELDEAQSGADNAQADVDEVRQEVQDAEAELNQAQIKKEEAETQKKEADEKAEMAGQNVAAAEEALDQVLQDEDKEEYEKVQQELEAEKEQQEAAQEALKKAEDDFNEKESIAQEAAAAAKEAQKAVESAQKDKEAADQAAADAQKEMDSAQKAYDDALDEVHVDAAAVEAAQQNLNQAKERYDEAVKKVESGSLGFFEFMKSEGSDSAAAAVTILTAVSESEVPGLREYEPWAAESWEEFISYTHLGDENDATNLENMKKTVEFIRECNELRKKDNNFTGNGDLLVNDALMAIAQLNANWAVMTETPGQLEYNSHSRVFNVGENLAWYPVDGDPFKGWYDEEKGLYDKGERDNSKVGHYLNITNWEYTSTGYAINFSQTSNQMWQNCAQEFSIGTINMGYGMSYSVSEYEERFMTYYNAVMKELSDAQAAYDAAKSAYDQAIGGSANQTLIDSRKAELDKAASNLESARENAQEKMEILNTAQKVMESSIEEKEAAQSAYEQSRDHLEAAQKDLQEKQEACETTLKYIEDNYGKEVAQAAERLANSRSAYTRALAVQNKAAEELGSAEIVLAAAEDKKADADQKLQEKSDILTRKLQALQDAKNAYSEALANLALAQADYDRLKPREVSYESNAYVAAEEHQDSEMVYAKEDEGQENLVNVTISNLTAGKSRKATFLKGCSFKYFLDYSFSFIKECSFNNLIIDCSDLPWFSFNKKTLEALRNSPDKTLTIIFKYKGRKYTFTIPSGFDLNFLLDSNGWYGFMYLKMVFGGYELV